eukprot:Nk52_evm13s179 gene=Nk52_evmTU13s179
MIMKSVVLLLCLVAVAQFVCSASTSGVAEESVKKTLVLIDNAAVKTTHAKFLKELEGHGAEVTVSMADAADLRLRSFGTNVYNTLVILAPRVLEFGGDIDTKTILEYFDDGGSLFVAGSSSLTETIRDLASKFGVEYDEPNTFVIDHFNVAAEDKGKHTMIYTDEVLDLPIVSGGIKNPIVYQGAAMTLKEEDPATFPIVTGESTAYSFFTEKPVSVMPFGIGKDAVLVAGMQARNNARAVFVGSMDMLSDAFFAMKAKGAVAGNEKFASSVFSWAAQEAGVLRIRDIKHNVVGELEAPVTYTCRDMVIFSAVIEERVGGKWTHFQGNDVQLEFVRVDPFVRLGLQNDMTNKRFKLEFELPDVYGVYKFKIDYFRRGYSHINSITQVSVRPFTHNQYERFIPAAYPYYLTSFSMMGGFLLFGFVFLNYKEEASHAKKTN